MKGKYVVDQHKAIYYVVTGSPVKKKTVTIQ